MLNALARRLYELVSGPLRGLKWGLLVALVVVAGVILGLLAVFDDGQVPGFLAFCFLSALLVLTVILLLRLSAKVNDLHYELSLQHNLTAHGYAIKDLYLDGAAANPSLLLLLVKCLHMSRPRAVLELGSGQTTKLLACYHRANPDTYVLTLEQDERWQRHLLPLISSNGLHHDYRYAPLVEKSFLCAGTDVRISTKWFDVGDDVASRRFGLILVDGPSGSHAYSRSGLLALLPGILDESFVIIFDDAERYGEVMTIRLLERMLREGGIDFVHYEVNGVKRQYVVCSPNLGFLRYT